MILGMDFLGKYNATFECRSKKVIFRPPGKEEFEYSRDGGKQPKMLIFAMKARKLLRNGYEGYLANTIGPLREG